MTTKGIHVGFKPIPTLISLFISLLIWFIIPVPSGVDPNAWHLLAIFVGVIAAIIWLIGISIMISKGLQKTGLGARLGYLFIAVWGKKTIGIGYSMVLSELLLAPVTPSNTARGVRIIHPIVRAISTSYDSDHAKGTEGRMGKYLALGNYQANPITSAMFITATAPNQLVVDLVAKATNNQISLSWSTWALAMLLPGLIALIIMPLIMYWMYPPEVKETPSSAQFAKTKLKEMGPVCKMKSLCWVYLGF